MRKLLAGLVAVLSLSLVTAQLSVAAVTPGTKCSKAGATSTYNGKKYTCVKSGKKLVWNKGVALPKPKSVPTTTPLPTPTQTVSPTPTPTESVKLPLQPFTYSDPCEKDPETPAEWLNFESWYRGVGNDCVGPFRLVETELTKNVPTTPTSFNPIDIAKCKIPNNPLKQNTLGFETDPGRMPYFNNSRHPSPDTVYQVVPIFTLDAPDRGTRPAEDYKKYFDFMTAWTKHASDNGSKVEFRVPDKYLEFPENIASYNLIHERKQEDAIRFNAALTKYVDSKIDFKGTNVVIVLLPPGSKGGIIQQAGLHRIKTNEGEFIISTFPPYTIESGFSGTNFLHPMWWIHELQHVGIGFDDNNQTDEDAPHQWGIISRYAATDLLGWQKWLASFWSDNQVICLSKTASSTAWIIPSQIKNSGKKLIAIPVDSKRVILIESMRSTGLNFKMPITTQGALVYIVDTNITKSHDGIRLLLPANRKTTTLVPKGATQNTVKFNNVDAPLKKDDYLIFEGIKISVVESGHFGDVIKVEKA
jgi:hypothetical protein